MKSFIGNKKQNKWTLLIGGLIFCAVAGFATSQLAAAEKDEVGLGTMDYLDPFNLTVTSATFSENSFGPGISLRTGSAAAPLSSNFAPSAGSSTTAVTPPLKIWIPYRPTFRSPCVPSI
ncbi:MAG: hypothetical protein KAS23_12465 [Anaerohalosphaera sp.]|nr:hypothetical protein [Anaerohalosphaera sp.]